MRTRGGFPLRSAAVAMAVTALLLSASKLCAEVYERGPKISNAYSAAGLSLIHKSTMDINGELASLEILAANGDVAAVASRFADAVKEKNTRAWFCHRIGTAFGFAQQGDSLTRFLFVQLGYGQTLLYTLHQSYPPRRSAAAAEVLPSDFPVYPGAQPALAIRHRETQARFTTYRAGGAVAVVQAYYEQALKERGWKALPVSTVVGRSPTGASQHMYRKGNSVCVISCEPDPQTGEVMITVLMKDTIL